MPFKVPFRTNGFSLPIEILGSHRALFWCAWLQAFSLWPRKSQGWKFKLNWGLEKCSSPWCPSGEEIGMISPRPGNSHPKPRAPKAQFAKPLVNPQFRAQAPTFGPNLPLPP